MEINLDELGGGFYASWGIKKSGDYSKVDWGFGEEDDLLNKMSVSGYQMLYETANWVGNGSFFSDFLGFAEISGDNVRSSLPDDPFCMNIRSTLNTISDWLHENQIDLVSHSHDDKPIGVDLFESLKFNGSEEFDEVSLPEDPFSMKVRSTLNTISDWFHENQMTLASESHDESVGDFDQMRFDRLNWFYNPSMIPQQQIGSNELDDDVTGEPHHDVFELVIPYLEIKDILAVEGVCRSLRDLVRKDHFFWRTIDLSGSFPKHRVTDDSLLKLTCRAQGHLQCLNLGGCVGITDDGLRQVLASNPHLTKLSVSGCHRLSAAGMLSTIRDLKSSNRLGVKSLITGGALYFTKEQFKELTFLLGADAKAGLQSRKQRFYTSSRSEFYLEDDQVIDLEICPWCEKPGLVFDCTAESCPLKDYSCPKSNCRACVVCIERCHDCGSCLNDCEQKPFCFAFSCVVCYMKQEST